jgi:hypothetical protein
VPRKKNSSPNWGGKRFGSGRKIGSLDRFSQALVREAYQTGEHPFQHLLKIMRDPEESKERQLQAAGGCLPYCMPRLAQVDMTVKSDLDNLSVDEKIALADSVASRILEHAPGTKLPELPATINGSAQRVE